MCAALIAAPCIAEPCWCIAELDEVDFIAWLVDFIAEPEPLLELAPSAIPPPTLPASSPTVTANAAHLRFARIPSLPSE
jgi:hypothetical protein